jgi:hypothetical protein
MSKKGTATHGSSGRPFYSRLAIGGLITIFAMMAVLGIVQLTSGDTSGLGFLVVNIVIVVIVGVLIWRFGS